MFTCACFINLPSDSIVKCKKIMRLYKNMHVVLIRLLNLIIWDFFNERSHEIVIRQIFKKILWYLIIYNGIFNHFTRNNNKTVIITYNMILIYEKGQKKTYQTTDQ